jgi:hypothetical protein
MSPTNDIQKDRIQSNVFRLYSAEVVSSICLKLGGWQLIIDSWQKFLSSPEPGRVVTAAGGE